ncbi:hypothetical protein POM88_019287 [Heracleum sosnowskyi]|uniref:Uncharacterized protein n=1 Tax=Heracleum sosnowskyi TaxID=360622 RepID=A0AAD8ITX4_9APIA|nr:hypothetical protein POM88_019287 [Heracleum sosnowskyi]
MAKSSYSVYLFFENYDFPAKYVYSFFKIDVQLENSNPNPNHPNPTAIDPPIFEFPADEYPFGMGCAQLVGGGSKFYFCGGVFSHSPSLLKQPNPQLKPMQLLNHVFPPYIYTLDTAAAHPKLRKMGGKMKTGKPDPIVFAANAKIYVLSAFGEVKGQLFSWFHKHKGCHLDNEGGLNRLVKLFECYDPVEDKWKALPDSPLRQLSRLLGYLLLDGQQKMVLTAWSFGGYSHFLYDLNQDTWLYELNKDTCISYSMLPSVNNWVSHHVGGFCYGIGQFASSRPHKLGPFLLEKPSQEDDQPQVSLSTISLVDPQDTLYVAHNFDSTSMLQHLGNTSFLFVSSAHGYINNDIESQDPYTHNVFVTIFKDVDADANLSSFKSKIIFSRKFVSKTDYDCLRKLRGCFHTPTSPVRVQLSKIGDSAPQSWSSPTVALLLAAGNQGADNEEHLKHPKQEET